MTRTPRRLLRAGPARFLLLLALAGLLPSAASGARTVVSIVNDRWFIDGQRTYPGAPAQGLLLNVRMVNATFEDARPASQWPARLPASFDPDANTRAFLEKLSAYRDSGVRAITLNLQGGSPGYEGAHNSAFEADGSLRPAYMERIHSVLAACDELGVAVILGCFYQRQHGEAPTHLERALAGREAIRAAVRNTALWLRETGFRHVLLEIANEYPHHGFSRWRDGEWLRTPSAQIELMNLARLTHPGLLVSTSGLGNGTIPPSIGEAADFLLVHLNNTGLDDIAARLTALKTAHPGKPIVVNEDAKTGAAGARAAEIAVGAGASWGYMGAEVNQYAPFEFRGPADDPAVYATLAALSGRAGPRLASGPLISVVIAHPTDGQAFPAGTSIEIAAALTQPVDQPVRRLRFFAGDTELGTVSSAPWTVAWRNLPAGRHRLRVEAVSRTNAIIATAFADVTVGEATAP